MFFSLLVLLVGLVVAGLTLIYVSYPRRGQAVPRAPWLGEAMQRRVEALPTMEPDDTVDSDLIHHREPPFGGASTDLIGWPPCPRC